MRRREAPKGEPTLGPLASLYDSARPLSRLSEVEHQAIKRRIRRTLRGGRRNAWRLAFAAPALLVAGSALATMGGIVAVHVAVRPLDEPANVANERALRGRSRQHRHPPARPPSPMIAGPPAPARTATPPRPPLPEPPAPRILDRGSPARALPSRRFGPPERGPMLPPRTTLPHNAPAGPAPEARGADVMHDDDLLAQAMTTLRVAGRPALALELLDQHAATFPSSLFEHERRVLRAETLIALGRTREAADELLRLPIADLPLSAERYTSRGELLAQLNRWVEAAADFDRALKTSGVTDDIVERALWGRATARLQLGESAGAAVDAGDYLARYPRGRFASQAARMSKR